MRIFHDFDPYLFQFSGGFGVRWYSLPYMLGIVLVYAWLWRSARRKEIPNLTPENLESLVIWAVIGTVVGARFFHVFVFEFSRYGFDPLAWIAIWRGGMAFHGGIIGCSTGVFLFTRRNEIPFYAVADRFVIPVALALGFGRIANFVNGEMPGTPYAGPFCVDYSVSTYIPRPPQECRHPTQLYEMAKNWVIALSLYGFQQRRPPSGVLFWTFVTLYGFVRFFLMFVRDEVLFLGPLTQSQVFSGMMALLGAFMVVRRFRIGAGAA